MTLLSVEMTPTAVQHLGDTTTKNGLLEKVAGIAARSYSLDSHLILDGILERESLGSTGFGNAIAIPHARLADLDHCVGAFVRLEQPAAFDAHDAKPVDLVFLLLSPQNQGSIHLKTLAEISRFLRDDQMVSKLRGARDSDALYALLAGQHGQQAA